MFKAALDRPICISNFNDLQTDMLPELMDADQLEPNLLFKKKCLRLFQMVWTGVTKNIKTIIEKGRGVEIPSLGIILPIEEEQAADKEAQSARLTQRALEQIKNDPSKPTCFLINEAFLNQL